MMETFWSTLIGSGVVATIFAFWMKSYFSPYLSEKAKNLATHEDIQKLVDQVRETERVKAEITDRTWDRQMRWNLKRDIYIRLLESVVQLIEDHQESRFLETMRRSKLRSMPTLAEENTQSKERLAETM